jgi:hypothetical protein
MFRSNHTIQRIVQGSYEGDLAREHYDVDGPSRGAYATTEKCEKGEVTVNVP